MTTNECFVQVKILCSLLSLKVLVKSHSLCSLICDYIEVHKACIIRFMLKYGLETGFFFQEEWRDDGLYVLKTEPGGVGAISYSFD